MASIMTVTVLLLVLMQCCCCTARRKHRLLGVGFTKEEMEKCKCKRIANGTYKCALQAMPVTGQKDLKMAMKACLCGPAKTGGRTNAKRFCGSKARPPSPPIPL